MPAAPLDRDAIATSLALTTRWATRCRARLDEFEGRRNGGGARPDSSRPGAVRHRAGWRVWRSAAESAGALAALDFDGYAIGGLSVGEPIEVMYEVVGGVAPQLPAAKPRYLMGVGTPADLVEAVARGIDLFDCVLPTRNARNGQLFTRQGPLNIKNARFAEDDRPPDPECGCYTCAGFSRAYLRHLYVAGEMTGSILNTVHNLSFYLDTMRRIRQAIAFGTFAAFKHEFLRRLNLRAFAS